MWIVSLFPPAVTPAIWVAVPAMYARAPAMSSNSDATGFFIAGLSVRSIVYLKVCAVTGVFEGGGKRKPGRIVNV